MILINEREIFQFTEAGHNGVTGGLVAKVAEEELELVIDIATIQNRHMEGEIVVDLIESHGPVPDVAVQFTEAGQNGVPGNLVAKAAEEELEFVLDLATIHYRHMEDEIAVDLIGCQRTVTNLPVQGTLKNLRRCRKK